MKIAVKVIPGACRNECLGWEEHPDAGRILRLRVAAPPVEGRANKEVIRLLADLLGIPKSSVTLLHGGSGRLKLIEIPDGAEIVRL